MKARTLFLTLALAFFGTLLCSAQSSQMGTWKINEAKSRIATGLPFMTTVTYEAQGDQVKVVTDGTDSAGKPIHVEWTGKFDGKDYPVTGDTHADARSYTQVDEHTLMLTNKSNGKVVTTAHIVTSPDGKTRTVQISATDATGKRLSGTAVYDKQ